MKYKFFFIFLFFLHFVSTFSIDDMLNDDPFFDELTALLDEDDSILERECTRFTPFNAVEMLTEPPFVIQDFILEDLYLRTHGINQRSLQDYQHLFFRPCKSRDWQAMTQFFYNKTHKNNFTRDSVAIESYIALSNENLIQRAEDLELMINIPEVLGLFTNLKVQERRGGVMFGAFLNRDDLFFELRAPLYYLIHNLYLNQQEQDAIKNSPLFDDNDPDTSDSQEARNFALQHLVSDQFGLGDTRINIFYKLVENNYFRIEAGPLFTIPTAFAFGKGLLGNHFEKTTPPPPFDWEELLCLALTDPKDVPLAREIATNFLVGSLDALSANVLQSGMGNGGHFTIGLIYDQELTVAKHFDFKSRASVQYILPMVERRCYIQKKIASDFLDRDYTNESLADQNLAFLNQQTINTFYPLSFRTWIWPGFDLQLTTALHFYNENLSFIFGYDLWWNQREKLGTIKAPKTIRPTLRTDIARRPGMMQHKIFGYFTYCKKGGTNDWDLSIIGDKTFLSYGIGKDFTIALRFELHM